ncbi:MAG: hypothetical protein G01um101418_557 [Parcubacteria group bacterium Gr01-1014_18]|nr:MAG: hypothetical protein Greene041636_603 [Parcubacteria group bacterium Greene0416_36]TSC80940.1 MAG: hypothetical protein G01um101418_557 [Parcubacteria group bacterium Gr01-1014_18]TSC98717.1 MAG: hypothetical protein Greene101420_591 [Parcubacteria group bacterium Greene1014_20]TSD06469.1 MAG: hypothetical protein Greene07142_899 [Parcubacteria group bacterium Greene0714_2]
MKIATNVIFSVFTNRLVNEIHTILTVNDWYAEKTSAELKEEFGSNLCAPFDAHCEKITKESSTSEILLALQEEVNIVMMGTPTPVWKIWQSNASRFFKATLEILDTRILNPTESRFLELIVEEVTLRTERLTLDETDDFFVQDWRNDMRRLYEEIDIKSRYL